MNEENYKLQTRASIALAAIIVCSGCASTQQASSQKQSPLIEAEIKMLNEQGKRIIAEVDKLDTKGFGRFEPTDILTVQVWLRDRKTQFGGFPLQQMVPQSGQVFIPGIGLTEVAGKTSAELKTLLSLYFDTILRGSTVVVEHTQKQIQGREWRQSILAVRHVTVMGWVRRAGICPIEPGVTVLDAIAFAGGLAEFANVRKIYLIRGSIDDPEVIRINLAKILTGKAPSQNIALEPNDAIYVPPVGMWKAYDVIRKALLPITGVRDAVWTASSVRQ